MVAASIDRAWAVGDSGFAPAESTSVVVVTLTPDLAKQWIERYSYPGQRPLKTGRLAELVETMLAGKFGVSDIRICYVGERGFVTNGNTRLHAVVRSGVPIQATVTRRILSSMEEVAEDFAHHDTGMSVRTNLEVYEAYGLSAALGLSQRETRSLASAATFIEANFKAADISRGAQRRVENAIAWASAGKTYFEAIEGGQAGVSRTLSSIPVASVGIVAAKYVPATATKFFASIAQNEGLSRGMPAHTLLAFLMDPKNKVTTVSYGRLVRATANCWNAFYNGVSRSVIHLPSASSPLTIEGSPYKNV